MILLYCLKTVGLFAAFAVTELFASGNCLLGLAALPMLLAMWWSTRQYARRRARAGAQS